MAHAVVTSFQWAGAISIFCALLAFTVALTQIIENAAVAIILAPIAYQIAQESHADPKPFMVGLAICISTSFCTPVAHENHDAGDGSWAVSLQELPFDWQRNGFHRLAARTFVDTEDLEVLIQCTNRMALGHYNRAIELKPNLAEAYEYRGVLLLRMGRKTAAEKDLATLKTLNPKLAAELERVIKTGKEGKRAWCETQRSDPLILESVKRAGVKPPEHEIARHSVLKCLSLT